MKKLFTSLLALLGLAACGQQGYENADVTGFAAQIADSDVVLLDVRTEKEFGEGHLQNALNIDVTEDGFIEKAKSVLPAEKTIAVYCRSGKRSALAAGALTKEGYKVVNLKGGIIAWKEAGMPVVTVMGVYNISGNSLSDAYDGQGQSLSYAFDKDGQVVFPDGATWPVGNLNASSTVALPDIYNNGHGFTCTGLAYDASNNTFLIGDIGKATPSTLGFASKIIRVSYDFLTVVEQIDLYTEFPNMSDVQGITIDTSDGTIWFCSTSEKKIRHMDSSGNSIGSITLNDSPTGVAYSSTDDCLWVLTYAATNNIIKMSKTGTVIEQYTFSYAEQLDQCFLDTEGNLYITAGANYISRNNVYVFNTISHEQSIACTVDSYSVEGIWIGTNIMFILNDGYYHSAFVAVNQVNIYTNS